MWLTFPCGQNSESRAALYVDFPSRLDFIICSNRQLFFAHGMNQRKLKYLAGGAGGQRPWGRRAGPFCLRGSLMPSSLVILRTKQTVALKGCFWLPLLTSGKPHVRTETCMKYYLVIILDNV